MDLIRFIFTCFGIHIRQHNLFASFASYSLQNIRTNSHANIQLLQNIRFEADICKTLSELHIQTNMRKQIFTYKRVFACKYSHTSEYLLCIDSNYIGKAFTSLRPQLIFASYLLIFTSYRISRRTLGRGKGRRVRRGVTNHLIQGNTSTERPPETLSL
jgi:hypothetical protein